MADCNWREWPMVERVASSWIKPDKTGRSIGFSVCSLAVTFLPAARVRVEDVVTCLMCRSSS